MGHARTRDRAHQTFVDRLGAGTAATTACDAANRPTTGANPAATYTSDDDGRLTARPGQRFEWDRLGRLVRVRPATGNSTIAAYTYDPLDRLRMVDYGGNDRTRFRYVGLTTAVAGWLDDHTGTVTRHVANGWTAERLADWTGGGSDLRIYGTNGHHDVTWLAGSTGSVTAALRYDPWGAPRSTVPSGYTPFRFQGSWHDATTDISWVVTRWYAPSLGRFISEDTWLGSDVDPATRHLYSYGGGEPIGRWDPDGRWWHKVRVGESLSSMAARWLGSTSNWRWIWNRNRERIKHPDIIQAGWCLWIPLPSAKSDEACTPRRRITGIFDRNSRKAAERLGVNLNTLTWPRLVALTRKQTGREASPSGFAEWWYEKNANSIEQFFMEQTRISLGRGTLVSRTADVQWRAGHPSILLPPPGQGAITIGDMVFLERESQMEDDALTAHEYIHVLQGEASGILLWAGYLGEMITSGGGGPSNKYEALGYLWEGYFRAYGVDRLGSYGDNQPWCHFKPGVVVRAGRSCRGTAMSIPGRTRGTDRP